MGRVIAYGAVVSLGFGALTVRSAVADVKDDGLKLGRNLADMKDMIGTASAIRINGQKISVGSGTMDAPVKTVLDRFEAHCQRDSAASLGTMAWGNLKAVQAKPLPTMPGLSTLGVLRRDDETKHDGVVLCFARGERKTSFLDGAKAFAASSNLNDFGDLRFVHAQQNANGTTSIQTIWTDGEFDTSKLMNDGPTDAPGSDSATLPRPNHSVRRFTAEALGAPYTARIYETTDAPDVVLKSFDWQMEQRGWLKIDDPNRDQDHELGRWYAREGLQAMISIRSDDGTTQVLVGEMGAVEKAPAGRPE
ncbi:MAG TPA: hypothetical protein VGH28_04320 [Polyangiaceae bacterium]